MQHAATIAEGEPAWLPRLGEYCGGVKVSGIWCPTGYSITQAPHLISCLPVAVSDLPWPPGGLLMEGGRYLSLWGPSVSASASVAVSVEVLTFPEVTGIMGVMEVAVTLGPGGSVWF